MDRRRFLQQVLSLPTGAILGGEFALFAVGCARKRSDHSHLPAPPARPMLPLGIQSGELTETSAVVWTKASRPGRMVVEWSESAEFERPTRVLGPALGAATDLTGHTLLGDLPSGRTIHYRVGVMDGPLASEWSLGEFKTAPTDRRDVLFFWSGDVVGQGWGIDVARGGMRIFEPMRAARPDFFLHAGDTIYADVPLQAEVPLPDGTVWRNIVTPAKSKVAETLDEFRGNYAYNLLDAKYRSFLASTPMFAIWDDHEVRNNWYPGQRLDDDPRYQEKDVSTLASRSLQALREYTPLGGAKRMVRSFRYGPSLEVFLLDGRSFRSPNSVNREKTHPAQFFGKEQVDWLKAGLASSRATWKVILCDMPLGVGVPDPPKPDGTVTMDAIANGEGPPLGREIEVAQILSFMKKERVRNVVFLTADLHYAAAHEYSPKRAVFRGFDPFWEFVAGPLHAGSFPPKPFDPTFGPMAKFISPPPTFGGPSEGLQFYGAVRIDGASERMTVSLHRQDGTKMYAVELSPVR